MVTKEQRAHDLAVAETSALLSDWLGKLNQPAGATVQFDFYGKYKKAYARYLDLVSRDFSPDE
jgi:hypothetical protein